jgi:hypothetical protein
MHVTEMEALGAILFCYIKALSTISFPLDHLSLFTSILMLPFFLYSRGTLLDRASYAISKTWNDAISKDINMVPAPPFFRLVDAAWRSLGVHGVVKPDCHAAGESAPGESPGRTHCRLSEVY